MNERIEEEKERRGKGREGNRRLNRDRGKSETTMAMRRRSGRDVRERRCADEGVYRCRRVEVGKSRVVVKRICKNRRGCRNR